MPLIEHCGSCIYPRFNIKMKICVLPTEHVSGIHTFLTINTYHFRNRKKCVVSVIRIVFLNFQASDGLYVSQIANNLL